MNATFWLLTTEGPWTPMNQSSVHHVLGRDRVRTSGLSKPPTMLKRPVSVPLVLSKSSEDPYGYSSDIVVAQYLLFHMEGFNNDVIAHYKLTNRPPIGWSWIVHPSKFKLILWKSSQ